MISVSSEITGLYTPVSLEEATFSYRAHEGERHRSVDQQLHSSSKPLVDILIDSSIRT